LSLPRRPYGSDPHGPFPASWGVGKRGFSHGEIGSSRGRRINYENHSRQQLRPSNQELRGYPVAQGTFAPFVTARDWELLSRIPINRPDAAFWRAATTSEIVTPPGPPTVNGGQLFLPGILDPYYGRVLVRSAEAPLPPVKDDKQLSLRFVTPGVAACLEPSRTRGTVPATA
jgi:hypothetical protein